MLNIWETVSNNKKSKKYKTIKDNTDDVISIIDFIESKMDNNNNLRSIHKLSTIIDNLSEFVEFYTDRLLKDIKQSNDYQRSILDVNNCLNTVKKICNDRSSLTRNLHKHILSLEKTKNELINVSKSNLYSKNNILPVNDSKQNNILPVNDVNIYIDDITTDRKIRVINSKKELIYIIEYDIKTNNYFIKFNENKYTIAPANFIKNTDNNVRNINAKRCMNTPPCYNNNCNYYHDPSIDDSLKIYPIRNFSISYIHQIINTIKNDNISTHNNGIRTDKNYIRDIIQLGGSILVRGLLLDNTKFEY